MNENNRLKFIVDENAGKLTKALRLLGYDTLFFNGENDTQMVNTACCENRIILTRDTHILKRRIVTSGKVKAILIKAEKIDEQIKQVMNEFDLYNNMQPFSLCLEDNQRLILRTKDEVQGRVPPYVWKTQTEFSECPQCHRIYWKGTHWEALTKKLVKLASYNQIDKHKDDADENSYS